jgi:hypothetical protein
LVKKKEKKRARNETFHSLSFEFFFAFSKGWVRFLFSFSKKVFLIYPFSKKGFKTENLFENHLRSRQFRFSFPQKGERKGNCLLLLYCTLSVFAIF